MQHRNIEEHGFPEELYGKADALFLDLPGPWKACCPAPLFIACTLIVCVRTCFRLASLRGQIVNPPVPSMYTLTVAVSRAWQRLSPHTSPLQRLMMLASHGKIYGHIFVASLADVGFCCHSWSPKLF